MLLFTTSPPWLITILQYDRSRQGGPVVMRAVLAAKVLEDHTFRRGCQARMIARDLTVWDHHVTGGFASQHDGMAELPALTL